MRCCSRTGARVKPKRTNGRDLHSSKSGITNDLIKGPPQLSPFFSIPGSSGPAAASISPTHLLTGHARTSTSLAERPAARDRMQPSRTTALGGKVVIAESASPPAPAPLFNVRLGQGRGHVPQSLWTPRPRTAEQELSLSLTEEPVDFLLRRRQLGKSGCRPACGGLSTEKNHMARWYSRSNGIKIKLPFVLNIICKIRGEGSDFSRYRDVDNLLNTLENGTLSDIDEESDDEIIQNTPKLTPRVGRNIVLLNEPLLDEKQIEHQPNHASAAYVNVLAKRIASPRHYLFYDNHFSNHFLFCNNLEKDEFMLEEQSD
ncbi:hypothetical protein EVAR_93236_1 [Eumeta japonica]|uniref:Uncharacterized protein n=1 Tax=Eumeta variegata TaxID=151549 RepID=A0A4C1TY13_EUMVA|nr:hypothetical protein EVAR_93236_1 [Eumeta japonica]